MSPLVASVRLRPFRLADAPAVEPWLTGPGLSVPTGPTGRRWAERLLGDRRIVARIAERSGRAVGFVRLDCGPDRIAEITLVIAPECRRGGLGSALFQAALSLARHRGIHRLVALVDVGNQPALQFFADQGFVSHGVLGDRIRLVRLVHNGGHRAALWIDG